MDEIETEIQSAVSTLSLPPSTFVACDAKTAADVVRTAKARFVLGDPRAWWLSLRYPAQVFDYPDASGPDHLREHIPTGEARCWFIVETESETLPVFDVNPQYIASVLRECRFFEYYVLGHDVTWLIAENDHNQLIVSRLSTIEASV